MRNVLKIKTENQPLPRQGQEVRVPLSKTTCYDVMFSSKQTELRRKKVTSFFFLSVQRLINQTGDFNVSPTFHKLFVFNCAEIDCCALLTPPVA